jgi:hypothetical protein
VAEPPGFFGNYRDNSSVPSGIGVSEATVQNIYKPLGTATRRRPLNRRLIFRSVHDLDANGHGGNRRLAQLVEILQRDSCTVEFGRDNFGRKGINAVRSILSGLFWSGASLSIRVGHPKAWRNAGVVAELCAKLHIDKNTIVFFDSYLRGYAPMFRHIKRRGGKIVVFPQNLDSLTAGTPDPMSSQVAPKWMHAEISAVRSADLVCCISREEQWLLSIFGIRSLYLPFYPTLASRSVLANIRAQRQRRRHDTILIVGSATNTPTYRGMKTLTDNAEDLVNASGGRDILLVGFGTEALKSNTLPANFHVVGSVPQSVMNKYLVEAAACVCYQPGTGGALTRIPELLCAGIPVIANYVAGRSYQNLPGVQIIETMDHLIASLRALSYREFAPPGPPEELEGELLRELRKL